MGGVVGQLARPTPAFQRKNFCAWQPLCPQHRLRAGKALPDGLVGSPCSRTTRMTGFAREGARAIWPRTCSCLAQSEYGSHLEYLAIPHNLDAPAEFLGKIEHARISVHHLGNETSHTARDSKFLQAR